MDLNKIVKKIRNSELSENDVLKYGRILITEFAKEYHKQQLTLTGVSQHRELFLELLEFVDNDLEQQTCEWLNEEFVDEFINSKNCG